MTDTSHLTMRQVAPGLAAMISIPPHEPWVVQVGDTVLLLAADKGFAETLVTRLRTAAELSEQEGVDMLTYQCGFSREYAANLWAVLRANPATIPADVRDNNMRQ